MADFAENFHIHFSAFLHSLYSVLRISQSVCSFVNLSEEIEIQDLCVCVHVCLTGCLCVCLSIFLASSKQPFLLLMSYVQEVMEKPKNKSKGAKIEKVESWRV